MENRKPWWKRRIFLAAIALGLLVVLGGAAGGIYLTQQPPEQPINFPHSTHVGLGAQCTFCHPGVNWGPTAGVPSISKCWGCHQQIQKQSPELVKLAGYVERNEPIPWVPVALQPDFVHFNHQPHIAAGVACETCHGDIASMRTAEPQAGQNMGWCLDCHKTMRPEKVEHLVNDCSTCHY